jgi:hypothetical protein
MTAHIRHFVTAMAFPIVALAADVANYEGQYIGYLECHMRTHIIEDDRALRACERCGRC